MSALLLLLPRPLYLPTTDHCRQNTTFVVPKGEAMLLRCFTYFAQKHVERLRDFLTFMPKIYSLCYKSFPKTYPSLSSVFPSSTHLRCMIISANWTKNGQGMFFTAKQNAPFTKSGKFTPTLHMKTSLRQIAVHV